MIGFSIDDFIERFEPLFPSYIKIDVGGIEKQIIEGVRSALADERMQSILIELNTGNPDESDQINKKMLSTLYAQEQIK